VTGYANTPTVVVVLVPVRGGLLMIRRELHQPRANPNQGSAVERPPPLRPASWL